jgi:hypothetical protein
MYFFSFFLTLYINFNDDTNSENRGFLILIKP